MVKVPESEVTLVEAPSVSKRQAWPKSTVHTESFKDYCTPEDAARLLKQTAQEFNALVKRFGIGRYHLPRQYDQIVYLRRDLERAHTFLNREGATFA